MARLSFGAIVMILQISCAGLSPKPPQHSRVPTIRVLLGEEREVRVVLIGEFALSESKKLKILLPRNKQIMFQAATGTANVEATVNGKKYVLDDRIKFAPINSEQYFEIFGGRYSGALELSVQSRGVRAINIVDMESYLHGVVPAEIGSLGKAEFEALKAQAVASRTYALKKLDGNNHGKDSRGFDIRSDIYDQTYHGRRENSEWAIRAVNATKGEVITFNNNVIECYFHSTCGGRTESGHNVFTNVQFPYLQGIADDFGKRDFCEDSPHYRWVEKINASELISSLREFGRQNNNNHPLAPGLFELRVSERFPSGRAKSVFIVDGKNNTIALEPNSIRALFQNENRSLRSSLFRVGQPIDRGGNREIVLIGAGFGHGVGMCQWGAIGMSRKGYSYDQMLRHYYRETELKKIY